MELLITLGKLLEDVAQRRQPLPTQCIKGSGFQPQCHRAIKKKKYEGLK